MPRSECTCLPHPYGDGPEADCPVHGTKPALDYTQPRLAIRRIRPGLWAYTIVAGIHPDHRQPNNVLTGDTTTTWTGALAKGLLSLRTWRTNLPIIARTLDNKRTQLANATAGTPPYPTPRPAPRWPPDYP